MKYIYITTVLLMSTFTGCSEDFLILDSPNILDGENFYQNEVDLRYAVSGAYSATKSFPVTFNIRLSEARSSNIFSNIQQVQRDLVDISSFTTTAETNVLNDAWKEGYIVIAGANKALEVIENLNLDNKDLNNRYRAEMRFLRGYALYNLTLVFGRIPLITELVSPDEALEIGQSELPAVYAQIVDDLEFAAENLPETYLPEDLGRATKMAAKSMLAEVYLKWSGFPVNNSAKLNDAIVALEEILAEEGGLFQWPTDYSELFKAENDNKFSLFEIQFLSGFPGVGASYPSLFLTISMKDFDFRGGNPRIAPSIDLVRIFDIQNDLRFNSSIGTSYVNDRLETIQGIYISKWFETGLPIVNQNDWPQNYPVKRPANVFLMHAEALCKRDGPSTKAIQSLNKTRSRAGLADLNPATKEEFELALNNEYRREFVAEGIYWHYLVRSGTAVDVMNTWFTETSQDITIDEHHLIYQIPFSQMFISPGLYEQNPGY